MKRIISFIAILVLSVLLTVPVLASGELVVDNADLLSASEEQSLNDRLQEISSANKASVVVVTTDTVDGKTWEAYADDFFDYNGYGSDGVLLLICMEEGNRGVHISTTGSGYNVFYDSDINNTLDKVVPYLQEGNYYQACMTFADCVEYQYIHGGRSSSGVKRINWGFNIIVGLGIGIIVALIVTLSMKKRHKTVMLKAEASNYMVPGSLNVTRSSDKFLYFTVTKREIPKNNNNGHSSHFGSSGTSHGGGGRSF